MTELQVVEPTEILVPLDAMAAQRLDKRIRIMAQQTRDNFEKVGRLLDEAKSGRVHEVLRFKSWTAYVADALGGKLELSGEARTTMIQMLAGEGMSVRAIAAATGVSKSTVDRDLTQVSHNGTPATDVTSESGVPQRDTSSESPDTDITITTLDGKTFTKRKRERKPRAKTDPKPKPTKEPVKPKPAARERQMQIPTAYRKEVDGLRPFIAGLKVLMQDPRWAKATVRFNHQDRVTLDQFIASLQELRTAMGELYNKTPIDE